MIRKTMPAPVPSFTLPLGGRRAILALLVLSPVLAGCGFVNHPVTSEDREARADCNAESDRVFAARNRYQMSERSSADTPYSSNTLPSNPTAGLSDQYEQDKLVDDCLRHGASANAKH